MLRTFCGHETFKLTMCDLDIQAPQWPAPHIEHCPGKNWNYQTQPYKVDGTYLDLWWCQGVHVLCWESCMAYIRDWDTDGGMQVCNTGNPVQTKPFWATASLEWKLPCQAFDPIKQLSSNQICSQPAVLQIWSSLAKWTQDTLSRKESERKGNDHPNSLYHHLALQATALYSPSH